MAPKPTTRNIGNSGDTPRAPDEADDRGIARLPPEGCGNGKDEAEVEEARGTPTVDAGIGISEDGLVTLRWVIFRDSPEKGSEAIGWITLTIAEDNSYVLEVVRHFHRKQEAGPPPIIASRSGLRQAEDDDGVCVDCGQHTMLMNEYYHVNDEVWAEARTDEADSVLCIGCLEVRIGRTLEPSDFSDAPINYHGFRPHSARLSDRLGHSAYLGSALSAAKLMMEVGVILGSG